MTSPLRLKILFQSLKGILSDLDFDSRSDREPSTVSIPKRDFIGFRLHLSTPRPQQHAFQSLKGILSDLDFKVVLPWGNDNMLFQSLKGILSDLDSNPVCGSSSVMMVSIPKRDFIGFRHNLLNRFSTFFCFNP